MLVPVTLFRISADTNQDWIGGTLYEALAKLCSEYNWRWHRVKEVGKHYITLEIMETWNTLEDVCNLWEDDAYDVTYHWDSIIAHVAEVPAVAAPAVSEEWREVMAGLVVIAEKKGKKQGSPNHCHQRPGIWDDDNGPVLSGKPCAECAMYDKARALLQSTQQSGNEPITHHPV